MICSFFGGLVFDILICFQFIVLDACLTGGLLLTVVYSFLTSVIATLHAFML